MSTMAYTETFSVWLEARLKEQGITQAELARRAGVTRGAINGILTGARGPGVDLSKGIAKALSLPPEMVLRAAGLLPADSESESNEEIEQILHELKDLTKEEQLEFLSYIRWRNNQRKKA